MQLLSLVTDGRAAIGHITAEAMDVSKSYFLPAPSTKQVLEELKGVAGPFDTTIVQKLQSTVTARETLKTQSYDALVCLNSKSTSCTDLIRVISAFLPSRQLKIPPCT